MILSVQRVSCRWHRRQDDISFTTLPSPDTDERSIWVVLDTPEAPNFRIDVSDEQAA
ncbi:MAG: hypothetical protein AAF334_10390 [Pseudomonadota bacterium]